MTWYREKHYIMRDPIKFKKCWYCSDHYKVLFDTKPYMTAEGMKDVPPAYLQRDSLGACTNCYNRSVRNASIFLMHFSGKKVKLAIARLEGKDELNVELFIPFIPYNIKTLNEQFPSREKAVSSLEVMSPRSKSVATMIIRPEILINKRKESPFIQDDFM